MPWGLKHYQQTGHFHFLTFSCYHRIPRFGSPKSRDVFVHALERARGWYGFYIAGYVVMPEHVHLLISEPERASLSLALQMLKQCVSRKLHCSDQIRSGSRATMISTSGARVSEWRSYVTCIAIP
jgi:putative transposase